MLKHSSFFITYAYAWKYSNTTVNPPNNVFPDNSNPLLEGAIDCASYKVYFNSYSEYTFIFFKIDSGKVYTNSDFEITK